jgi:hypothetical protein
MDAVLVIIYQMNRELHRARKKKRFQQEYREFREKRGCGWGAGYRLEVWKFLENFSTSKLLPFNFFLSFPQHLQRLKIDPFRIIVLRKRVMELFAP